MVEELRKWAIACGNLPPSPVLSPSPRTLLELAADIVAAGRIPEGQLARECQLERPRIRGPTVLHGDPASGSLGPGGHCGRW